MKNKGRFVRMFFALSLILSLGVAPELGVHAQQAAPRTEAAAEKSAKAADEKPQQPSAEGEPLPLSDAEMNQVEGGIDWGAALKKASDTVKGLLTVNVNVNVKSHNKTTNRCR